MKSRANIKGHPLHPILVSLPVGLLVFSFICDLTAIFSDQRLFWIELAFTTLAAGVVSAVIAAIPGLIDYLAITDTQTARIGTKHLIANLLLVFLSVMNLVARSIWTDMFGIQALLSLPGILLLVYSGWLGGEMIYRHGMGVDLPVQERFVRPQERESAEMHPEEMHR